MNELDPLQVAQVSGASCIESDMATGARIGYQIAQDAGAVVGAALGAVFHFIAH